MTNREAFNQYIRMAVEKQLRYMETMSDDALVQYVIDHDYHIDLNIGDKISYFKVMTNGIPVGSKERVIAWFKDEAPEKIDAAVAAWEQLSPEELRRIGEAGHTAALEKYTYRKLAKEFAALFG